jgi:hypothetical protein
MTGHFNATSPQHSLSTRALRRNLVERKIRNKRPSSAYTILPIGDCEGTIPSGSPLDKRREAHHRMAFGNHKIKADFGGERITDRNSATAFMLALTAIYRNKPHWKLADQALRQASKSAAAESRASAAFKAAIEAEGWLEN